MTTKAIVNAAEHRELTFRLVTDDAELPAIVALAKLAHQESRFSYIPFSADKVRKIARAAFKDTKRHAVMIASKGETPVGCVYCSVGEFHIGTGVLITTIHGMTVSKEVRASLSGGRIALGLFKGVESWAKARNAHEVLFHVTSGVNLAGTHKLAKRIGFQFIGGSYVKVV